MDNTVYVKSYAPSEFNIKEILRYAGVKKSVKEIDDILSECLKEIENKLIYKVCFRCFPVSFFDDYVDLGFAKCYSKDLIKNLKGCSKIVLFGATVGIETDRLIAKYNRISPVKALMFQAIGAERIESLCDIFNDEIKKKYYTVPRFSPGYGDLKIEFQKQIFKVLDPSRKIGLTLNESLLMTPSKSVTAIIGISDFKCEEKITGCQSCSKQDCEFRRIQ